MKEIQTIIDSYKKTCKNHQALSKHATGRKGAISDDFIRTYEKLKAARLEQNPGQALEKVLSERWSDIAHSFLRYTALPDSDANQLCEKIAKALASQAEDKSWMCLLMPTLTLNHDDECALTCNTIDDFELNEVIITDDLKSLIPLELIES